ncbi:MAG: hypothetical protein GW802_09350 [Armatimonadetes bacterium]|nr:hypothetical protein [Armatimonadota bacterium]
MSGRTSSLGSPVAEAAPAAVLSLRDVTTDTSCPKRQRWWERCQTWSAIPHRMVGKLPEIMQILIA